MDKKENVEIIDEKVSIIIPAFNEEENIAQVITKLYQEYPSYEIIVIDDGSTDKTASIIENLPCTLIKHNKNKGYGASWKTGIQASTHDNIVFFDGDNQFDVSDIEKILAVFIKENAAMVSGCRGENSHIPLKRKPLKIILKYFVEFLLDRSIPDLNCGLRVFKKSIIKRYMHLLPDGFSASTTSLVVLFYRNYSVNFVPITTVKRGGKSSVKIFRDGFNTVMLIVRLVALFNPLRIFLPVSFFSIFVAIVYSLIESLTNKLGIPVLGALIFITGIITFFFGVLCDQISSVRLHQLDKK